MKGRNVESLMHLDQALCSLQNRVICSLNVNMVILEKFSTFFSHFARSDLGYAAK